MKNILTLGLLLSTLSLVSCNAETSAKSRTCTFNDQPVDCSTMNPQVSQKGLTLSAKVKSKITINEDELEVLENQQSIVSDSKDGKDYECAAFTQAGEVYQAKVKNKTLQLSKDGNTTNFTLVSNEAKGIQGSWKNVENDEDGSSSTTLVIREESMEVLVDCRFN